MISICQKLPILLLAAAAYFWTSAPIFGQAFPQPTNEQTPDERPAANLAQKLNAQVPGNLSFIDDHNQPVNLSSIFATGRPIVLQLGYYECPQLCSVISKNFLEAAKKMDLKAGKDFEFVFISVDPADDYRLAALKRQSYLLDYGDTSTAAGFHFFVGHKENIAAIADAVGFRYVRGESPGEYGAPTTPLFAHPAVIMVLTPDGRIYRYFQGTSYDPRTLQLSLDEASQGKVGTTVDRLELLVCSFNAITGKYAATAMKIMRLSGLITMLGLGGTLFWLFRREHLRRTI